MLTNDQLKMVATGVAMNIIAGIVAIELVVGLLLSLHALQQH